MFESFQIINALYQLFFIALFIGIILFVISFIRGSDENKKRIKRLEEKIKKLEDKK